MVVVVVVVIVVIVVIVVMVMVVVVVVVVVVHRPSRTKNAIARRSFASSLTARWTVDLKVSLDHRAKISPTFTTIALGTGNRQGAEGGS